MPENNSQLLEITQDLVRMQTVADRPDELHRAIDYVDGFFRGQKGVVIHRYEKDGKPSIVIQTQDTKNPDILFLGHIDVVPGDPYLFEPRIEEGILYGRGVCDMKSEIAVMMLLMKEVLEEERDLNIALAITTDEEIGGERGAAYLVNDIGYKPKMAIVPDSGRGPNELVIWNKGIWHLEISAKGRTAHGSRPWEGENAIDKVIDAYVKIRDHFTEATAETFWQDTCNIGMISGGGAVNQVPDRSSCKIDIRYVRPEDKEALLETVQGLATDCEVTVLTRGDASFTDPKHPTVSLYQELLGEQLSLEAEMHKSCGGHDGRYLTAIGIPVICSRPRSGGQHSPDEWLDIESLTAFYELYRSYIDRLGEIL